MPENPIHCAIVTTSDRASSGIYPDLSGTALADYVTMHGWQVLDTRLIPDELELIKKTLVDLCSRKDLDIILTTGGTGFTARDVTPEATLAVVDKVVPGIPELMRAEGRKINPNAILSRACCGIRGSTLIVNLPGSPKAVIENMEAAISVFPHSIEMLRQSPTNETGHRPGDK